MRMTRLILILAVLVVTTEPSRAQQPTRLRSLPELETSAAHDSLDPDAQYLLALGYARAKRFDDEATALRRAIAINSRYAPAYVALSFEPFQRRPGLAREIRNRKVPRAWQDTLLEANRLLHQAFIIDPLAELSPPDPDPDRARMVAAMNFGLALRYGRFPLDSLPSWLLWHQGLMDGRSGRYDTAIAAIRVLLKRAEAIENDSIASFPVGTNEFRYVLAVLYDRAGKPADALAFYRETLAGDLGHYMAHARLAILYRDHQMWTDAVTEAQHAVETNPEDPATRRELGEILLAAGRLPEAEAALRDARQRNPRDIGTEYVLGIVLERLARPAEARMSLQRFVDLAPATLYAAKLQDARQHLAALPP